MTGRKSFAASAGITSPVAAIVIVIIVCGSAFGIVELQLSSTDSGRSTVTATVTTTLISTTTIVSSTHLTQSGIAQVAVTATSLRSSDFLSTNAGVTFTCGAVAGSYLTLSNVGTAGTSVDMVTITSRTGQTDSYSPAGGSSCSLGAAGSASATQNLLFASTTKLDFSATSGGSFSGTVSLGSGAIKLFAGTFQ